MRIALLTSLAFAAFMAAVPAAVADTERMSDSDFLRANQCAAHYEAQGVDPAALALELRRQHRNREAFFDDVVRDEARAIGRQWRRADTAEERAVLAGRQAQACAGFETLTAGLSPAGAGGL